MSFETVRKFEEVIADFYDAPYAVAVDCCTHAIELCLRHTAKPDVSIGIPNRTYISVPFTLEKLGLKWHWVNRDWKDYYHLEGTDIIDAAVYFKSGTYIPLSFMCLSFQFKKPLSLGRGGAILCQHQEDYEALKKMAYDGRLDDQPWGNQAIDSIGYHYYMTPEIATLGLQKLPEAIKKTPKQWTITDWPDLTKMEIFK